MKNPANEMPKLLEMIAFFSNAHPKKPGAAVNRMPESVRKQLRGLKSKDVANVRLDWAGT